MSVMHLCVGALFMSIRMRRVGVMLVECIGNSYAISMCILNILHLLDIEPLTNSGWSSLSHAHAHTTIYKDTNTQTRVHTSCSDLLNHLS